MFFTNYKLSFAQCIFAYNQKVNQVILEYIFKALIVNALMPGELFVS